MNIDKYYARAQKRGPQVAHTIQTNEDGTQSLLCHPNGKSKPGTFTKKPLVEFLRECDLCIEATAKIVTTKIQGQSK